jgi:hypothetical protein
MWRYCHEYGIEMSAVIVSIHLLLHELLILESVDPAISNVNQHVYVSTFGVCAIIMTAIKFGMCV